MGAARGFDNAMSVARPQLKQPNGKSSIMNETDVAVWEYKLIK